MKQLIGPINSNISPQKYLNMCVEKVKILWVIHNALTNYDSCIYSMKMKPIESNCVLKLFCKMTFSSGRAKNANQFALYELTLLCNLLSSGN